jgi:signal transduction histidine kinase
LESLRDATITLDRAIVEALPRAIHKTAQPLTLLRGLLELMLARVSNGDERESLEQAVDAAQRLTTCFGDIRTLVGLQGPERDSAGVQLSLLVTDVLRNLESDIATAGVTALFDGQRKENVPSIWVRVPQSRACLAIGLVLRALLDCLAAGDWIQVSIDSDGSRARISLRPSRPQGPAAVGGLDHLLSRLAFQMEPAQPLLASTGCEVHLDEAREVVIMSWPTTGCHLATQDRQREAMHV